MAEIKNVYKAQHKEEVMCKKMFSSFIFLLALLAIFSQPVLAEGKYKIMTFQTCDYASIAQVTDDVNRRAEQWMNIVASKVKIISHALSVSHTSCAVLTILYTEEEMKYDIPFK
ncbi:TPA: hypothetical protein DEP58_01075 [Patescibacteria group bacterium]|nr:hypothetical protein [Patescibacteria group bacterium]